MNATFAVGFAPGTRKAYHRHFERYVRWVTETGVAADGYVPRPSEVDLIYFADHLGKTIGAGAVKATLAGVAAGFVERGFGNVTRDQFGAHLPRLRRMIRAISRKGGGRKAKKRKALTVGKLERLLPHLRAAVKGSAYDAVAYAAALSMAVYLLLRVSECTAAQVAARDPRRSLNFKGAEVLPSLDDPQWLQVRIKASKVDVFREGVTLKVAANGPPTCPVRAMARWMRARVGRDPKSPLFVLADGSFVTRSRLQAVLQDGIRRAGYDPCHYTTHSLRIGGATTLACAGCPSETLMLLGRWASDCYVRYLRVDDARRREISASMALVQTSDLQAAQTRGLVSEDGWIVP